MIAHFPGVVHTLQYKSDGVNLIYLTQVWRVHQFEEIYKESAEITNSKTLNSKWKNERTKASKSWNHINRLNLATFLCLSPSKPLILAYVVVVSDTS